MPRPPAQSPVVEQGKDHLTDQTVRHPAFGMLGASRVSGRTTLFGSDFVHQNFISVTLYEAHIHRSLSHDHHFADKIIAQWSMSEAQWATFVSAMNVGHGVPVTLEHTREGDTMLWHPAIKLEPKIDDFKEDAQRGVRKAMEAIDAAAELLENDANKMSAKVRDSMRDVLRTLKAEMTSHFPFILKSLDEHMEKSVEKAKTDVHAYVLGEINRLGLAVMRGEEPGAISEMKPPIVIEDQTPKKGGVTIKKKGSTDDD